MSYNAPQTTYLKDYQPPAFLVETAELHFHLEEETTRVESTLLLKRNPNANGQGALVLNGVDLELLAIALDGKPLTEKDYTLKKETLTIPSPPEECTLTATTRIDPKGNSSLEGLYISNGMFCTQCEAEGFRKITYYPDRPDVMARFSCTIEADKERYPVLLCNGNPVDSGELDGGRYWARWEDPFPKPSYLFALVAGNLVRFEDRHVTPSGREVKLEIYVEPANHEKCDHAMRSLKQAMRWDEEQFGLEYDLDIYMIVAVDHFNMGAMENKGLNIFNSKYVLASPETATDSDYTHIQGVIGHEYFHNWTGNRVTCRDWFQLSLKEGLTVFRDQEFSSDMHSRAAKRIGDVRMLRTHQFAEDSGPLAHPVRPDSYVEINNFYTLTVYEKGAELIRMYHTLLGAEGFRKGMQLYFERHDGQAVTTDDFLQAMQDANGIDLGQFRLWYGQAGTPELHVKTEYDEAGQSYTLQIRQQTPPTPGQEEKVALQIPIRMGLLGPGGKALPLKLDGETEADGEEFLLQLRETEQTFRFTGVEQRPVPSLLRGFSAPVKLRMEQDDTELAFLMANDSDPFNRWDAAQRLMEKSLLGLIEAQSAGRTMELPDPLRKAFGAVLARSHEDQLLAVETMTLPSESYLGQQMEVVEVDAIHAAHRFIRTALATEYKDQLLQLYDRNQEQSEYTIDPESMGRRALKNLCLAYLMDLEGEPHRIFCMEQFKWAENMTDSIAALNFLANSQHPKREKVLGDFYDRWENDPLVIDKWFSIQAASRREDTLLQVQRLMHHPSFDIKTPNRVRALIGVFCHGNQVRFHSADGEGYRFLADQVLKLDPLNPQVAARMLGAMNRWRQFEPARRELMKGELERIADTEGLSPDVYEVTAKSLGTYSV